MIATAWPLLRRVAGTRSIDRPRGGTSTKRRRGIGNGPDVLGPRTEVLPRAGRNGTRTGRDRVGTGLDRGMMRGGDTGRHGRGIGTRGEGDPRELIN